MVEASSASVSESWRITVGGPSRTFDDLRRRSWRTERKGRWGRGGIEGRGGVRVANEGRVERRGTQGGLNL